MPPMALSNVDFESVFRLLADRRIEEAMREGKFDNLSGAGQPLELEPLPADENAKALWWALKIMRNANVTPDEIRWRKQLDQLRARIEASQQEQQIHSLVREFNEIVHRINTLGTNAVNLPASPLDLHEELDRFRSRGNA
jgi:hypothetical protein